MSDMKCPFCGKKLWYDEQDGIYRCMKKSACVMHYEGGTEQLWQELIRTRKALDVAVCALNTVTATPLNSRVIHDVANEALDKITALEQKE